MPTFRGFGPSESTEAMRNKVQRAINVGMPQTMSEEELAEAKRQAPTRRDANAIDRLNRQIGETMIGRVDGRFVRIMCFSNRIMIKPFLPALTNPAAIAYLPFAKLLNMELNPVNRLYIERIRGFQELPSILGRVFIFRYMGEEHTMRLMYKSARFMRDYLDAHVYF